MKPLAFLLACFAMISSGCFTPQFMPASNIECRVFDEISKQPIKGAAAYMVYVGANGQTERRGPFVTDERGITTIVLKKEALWQSGAEAGFAGGYLRHIEIMADTYQDGGRWENFDRGRLDRESPITFYLKR